MKKFLLTCLILLNSLAYCQKETLFFPEDQPEILIGKKIKALPDKYEMYPFVYYNKKTGMYLSGNSFANYKKYLGKTFVVKNVISDDYRQKYLVLNEVGKQNDLYYRYNPTIDSDFKFSIIDFEIPYDFYCNQIQKIGNDFSAPNKGVIIFKKYDGSIMLEVRKYGNEMLKGNYDVVLFLEDKTTIQFPNQKVDTKLVGNNFEISSLLTLSSTDIEKLQQLNIVGYLLGNINNRYPLTQDRPRIYLNCLILK